MLDFQATPQPKFLGIYVAGSLRALSAPSGIGCGESQLNESYRGDEKKENFGCSNLNVYSVNLRYCCMKKRFQFGRRKWNNTIVKTDDGTFHSKKELKRWEVLKLRLAAGEISNLRRQVRFQLKINDFLICSYISDFVYSENGKSIVEDAKGFRTPEYKLKAKMMKAIHGIDIREV